MLKKQFIVLQEIIIEIIMKNLFITACLGVSLIFNACSSGESEKSNNQESSSIQTQEELFEGNTVEFNVLKFDIEKRTTEVEISNGLDKAIKNIKGELVFFDENDQEITFATGRSKASPFQKVENPFLVDSKRKKTITFSNQIEAKTAKIEARLTEVETVDGTVITL